MAHINPDIRYSKQSRRRWLQFNPSPTKMTGNHEETAMRRFFVPALILSIALLRVASPTAAPAAEKKAADESATADSKDESKKKDSEAAKKDSSAKSDTSKDEKEKAPAKDTDKSSKAESEKKEKDKATDAAAKDKTAKPAAKDDKKPAAKPEAKKRKTLKVETKRLKVVVPLDGVFVARKMEEVALRPEVWSEYEIEDVIEHGAKVHKGQRLFKFDDEKINQAIQDMELEQRMSDLVITKAEDELPRLEKTLKLDFGDAERSAEHAKADLKQYNEVDRPMAIKSAEFMVKYYNFMLDYEKDELRELEKMYKADDLTEETEEIVLKRQRNQVEFAQFSLEGAKQDSDEMIKVRIPRMDIRMKEQIDRTTLAKARAQMALSTDLNRARQELEQRKKMRAKALDRQTKILADKELMEIKSPADGIVFYGQCVNGRWSDTPSLINRYKPHSNVSGNSILMTIIESRPLWITSTIDESKRPDVTDGQKVKVALPLEGSDHVSGEVKSISPIPVGPGKFGIDFDVKQDQIPDWVIAGMSCKVQITTYDKADTLAIPKKAVHDDKDDPDQHYVWLVDADDTEAKPERRNVKLGHPKDDDVEILKGLKKGNVISLDDEEAKDKADKEKDTEKDKEKEE
jgi:multidrug resistance efflux pump